MNVNSVNQLFNEKLQNINSKLPTQTNVNNKFQEMLEKCQLKTSSTSSSEITTGDTTKSSDTDINSLLKTMLSTQSTLSSITQSSDSSSSLFPTSTLNNNINMFQQMYLLNTLKNDSESNNSL